VYRQLEKLIKDSREDETTLVKTTAAAIEEHLKSNRCHHTTTPFIHVFSPVALVSAQQDKKGLLTTLTKKTG